MNRALNLLAAFFATAAVLLLSCIIVFVFRHVLPALPKLMRDSQNSALIGLMLGYGAMFTAVYFLSAWVIWRRVRWNMAVLLAIAACFGFPIGPVLGLAAIILLTRPTVRASFTN